MKKQSGITLIALIITIVVLLILAAVAISLTLGERGIFNTAQKAGKNYKEASDKELAELSNLEKEMQNAINGTENGGAAKPNPQPVKLNTLDATHYGDYVDYPVEIGRGPVGIAETHKSDWRIFYNDGTYVYLISSYLLLNSEVPTEIGLRGVEGRPYTIWWDIEPTTYTPITESVRANYKMSWNKSTTNPNIKAVSTLLDTSKWTKFVDSQYAEDAIGGSTLEMWVESWNATGGEKLYCNNSNENGYYIGKNNIPTQCGIKELNKDNNLYFPILNLSEEVGFNYWLLSPSALNFERMILVHPGEVGHDASSSGSMSVRPIVRLKSNIMAKQDTNNVWKLQ